MILIWCNFILTWIWYMYLRYTLDLVWRLLLYGLWRRVLGYIGAMISEVHSVCKFNVEECSVTVTSVLGVNTILNDTRNNKEWVSSSALKTEASLSSEMLVAVHVTILRHTSEDSNHHRPHENLRCHMALLHYLYYDLVLVMTWVWHFFLWQARDILCNTCNTHFKIKGLYI